MVRVCSVELRLGKALENQDEHDKACHDAQGEQDIHSTVCAALFVLHDTGGDVLIKDNFKYGYEWRDITISPDKSPHIGAGVWTSMKTGRAFI